MHKMSKLNRLIPVSILSFALRRVRRRLRPGRVKHRARG